MPGWQITLIALGATLAAVAVTIVLTRARAAHRAVPSPAATPPGSCTTPAMSPDPRTPAGHAPLADHPSIRPNRTTDRPDSQTQAPNRQDNTMFMHPYIRRESAVS